MDSKKLKYERIASVFIGGAVLSAMLFCLAVLTTKGWFEAKNTYYTVLESGDGVHVGSPVEMVGIRIGVVSNMELDEKNRIRTHLRLLRKYQERVREDSRIVLARPFIVGDKVLHLTPGTPTYARLPEGSTLPSDDSLGVMDMLGGKKAAPYLKTLELAAAEMKKLVDLLLKEKGSEKVAASIAGLPKLISKVTIAANDLSSVSRQMSEDERMGKLIANLSETSEQIRANSPEFAKEFSSMVSNMSLLSEEFKKVVPAIAVIAPDLPQSSKRLVQALDEAVIVMKAMQKSFFLRGSAREVREEEEAAARVPASSSESESKE